MADIKEELTKHLNTALELEQKSMEMYTKFAEEASSQHAQLLFERMVKEEEKHVAFVTKLKENLIKNTVGDQLVDSMQEMDPSDITAIRDKTKAEVSESYLSALAQVVEFEDRAYSFYRELESSADSRTLRKIFKTLADFEKQHHDIFKEELDNLKNNPYM